MNKLESYELEKTVWTEDDFEAMGWHDVNVWGIVANPQEWEYLIDLDYIFKWVHPEDDEEYYKFWVAPVTMVFENAYDVRINIESRQGEIEVADLHMENARKTKDGKFTEYTFRFECQEGEITLNATGYKMYVRQKPVLVKGQTLEFEERGGISFDRILKTL